MKKKVRSYSQSTIKALFARSGNLCASPSCNAQLTIDRIAGDGTVTLGDIAHIYPIGDCGPRHNSSPSEIEINNIDNLLLLCAIHHRLVDSDPDRFPAEKLRRWKHEHEASVINAALAAKSERDPKTLHSLKASLHFDYSKPEDYREIARLLEHHKLKNMFWGFVSSGMDDNLELFSLGRTLAQYFNCIGRREEAQEMLDACLEMYPTLFPKDSEESRLMMASLLHERYGHLDQHTQEVDFCLSKLGPTNQRTILAELCRACELLRTEHLDEAQRQLADCSRKLTVEKDVPAERRALLDFQFGKLYFHLAARERQPKMQARLAVDYLRAAEAQFDRIDSDHTTLAWIRFFLFKAAGLAGYRQEAERNYKLAKAFFGIAPLGGLCHYSDGLLRKELSLE